MTNYNKLHNAPTNIQKDFQETESLFCFEWFSQ